MGRAGTCTQSQQLLQLLGNGDKAEYDADPEAGDELLFAWRAKQNTGRA